MDRIAAFIDGSAYAASVCDHAAWAAARMRAPVVLVHALDRPVASAVPGSSGGVLRPGARRSLMERLARHDAEAAAVAVERGQALLEDARARLLAAADIEVDTELCHGDPVRVFEEMQTTTRLALIGKRGERASGPMAHLGSNLERLVRISARPVLVTNRVFRPVARLLIAFDGGPSAGRAVACVAESPVLRGAEAHVLTAGPGDAARLEAEAGRLRAAGFTVHGHRSGDSPEAAIAAAVRDCGIGLLVLGKSGNSRLRQLVIGSTTLALMRSCPVPVLIVP